MAKQFKRTNTKSRRPVDVYFDRLSASHQLGFMQGSGGFPFVLMIALMVFSVIGLAWTIPFPKIEFLYNYGRYVNWGYLVILLWFLYTVRLSVALSFLLLLFMTAFSEIVKTLTVYEENGGQTVWFISLSLFITSWVGQYIYGQFQEGKTSFKDDILFVLITPIWVLHFLAKKIGLRY